MFDCRLLKCTEPYLRTFIQKIFCLELISPKFGGRIRDELREDRDLDGENISSDQLYQLLKVTAFFLVHLRVSCKIFQYGCLFSAKYLPQRNIIFFDLC